MTEELSFHHNVVIENRKNAVLSGVKEVNNYSDESVELVTVMGKLCIKGSNLKIESFSTEKGEIYLNGQITAFIYVTDVSKGGFFSRLFK